MGASVKYLHCHYRLFRLFLFLSCLPTVSPAKVEMLDTPVDESEVRLAILSIKAVDNFF